MPRKRSSRKPQPALPVPALAKGSVGADIAGAEPRQGRAAWLALLLVPVVWVAFAPILDNAFVDWDDNLNFLDNQDFRGLGWTQIRWAWTTRLLGVYQPLSWMILEAEYALCGMDPRGYHAASIVFCCLNALALDALVVALLRRCRPEASAAHPWALHAGAALAVALFLAHPLRVELVAWASCQPYLPCALLLMLALLAYLRANPADGSRRLGWSITALGLYIAALLCKAVAVPFPLVLLILDVYPLRRLRWHRGGLFGRSSWPCWLEKVPYFALSVLFAAIAVRAKDEVESLAAVPFLDEVNERFAQACYGVWFYLAKTVWPVGILPYYPLPLRPRWDEPLFVLCRLLLIMTTVSLVLARRIAPGLLVAWLSYLVILAPNSGLVRIGNQIAADRYSYVAMIGLVPLVAVVLATALRPIVSRRQPAVVLVLVLCVLAAEVRLTRKQCTIWHDTIHFWTHAYKYGDTRYGPVLNNLGFALVLNGRPAEAIPFLVESLANNPNNPNALHSLGSAFVALGRDDEAKPRFEEALRLKPGHADSLRDLEQLLARQKTHGAAVSPERGR